MTRPQINHEIKKHKLTTDEILSHVTELTFYPSCATKEDVNRGLSSFALKVSYRSEGKYAVVDGFRTCWNGVTNDWDQESSPSNRTDEFKEQTRFPLEEAISIALSVVDSMVVNGLTLWQWHEHWDKADAEKAEAAERLDTLPF